MQESTDYNNEVSEDGVIENRIMKGATKLYVTKHNNFGEFVLDRLRATPDIIGQVNGLTGQKESFAEMTEKCVKCAMWLKNQNVQPGDVIGICTHNQMDMYVPCLASLFIGAVFNPWWDVGITKEVAKHFLTLTSPRIVFADEASAELLREAIEEIDVAVKIIVFGNLPGHQSLDDVIASQNTESVSEFRCTKLSSHAEPAVITYTSGTTGLPKGALHSHRSLFGNVENFFASEQIEGTAISLLFSPLAWTTGVLRMMRAMTTMETRVICPVFTEEITFQLIEKFKINWMLMGTSPAIRIEKSPAKSKYDLSSLKYLYVTGSVLKRETHDAMSTSFPRTKVLQAYGTTELGGAVIKQDSEQLKSGSCGRILNNVMMKVIDPEGGTILGPNQTGEACFKTPYMMTCYYGNPTATKETIDAQGWLHSGDLAHYDEDGNVFVANRIKEMIKYRGHHVSPAMIEQLLQAHPGVLEVAVIAAPHPVDDEHPIAFVATTPHARLTETDLQKLVSDKLPDYMKLRGGVQFLKELPHTASGKISKSDLRNMLPSRKVH